MDFAYTPHRDAGGALHLPSSSHSHPLSAPVTRFSSLDKLRQSLSRSPSKLSSASASASANITSPVATSSTSGYVSVSEFPSFPPIGSRPRLALSSASTAAAAAAASSSSSRKPKFALRRTLPQRAARLSRPGSITTSGSTLQSASLQGAPTPPVSAVGSSFPISEETRNLVTSEQHIRHSHPLLNSAMSSVGLNDDGIVHSAISEYTGPRSSTLLSPRSNPLRIPHSPHSTDVVMSSSLVAVPISSPKTPSRTSEAPDFAASRSSRPGLALPSSSSSSIFPPKTSPLKRTDGAVNLDLPNSGSPVPKRRQLQLNSFTSHPNSPPLLSPRTIIPQSALAARRNTRAGLQSVQPLSPPSNTDSPFMPMDGLPNNAFSGSRRSPRRAFVLRRPGGSRPPSTRISTGGFGIEQSYIAPFTSSCAEPPTFTFNPLLSRKIPPGPASALGFVFPPIPPPPFAESGSSQHPETQTNTAFPGLDGMSDDISRPSPARRHARTLFSRSLPIGSSRPSLVKDKGPNANTISTPAAYKNAKPIPEAFMSTGLISKRNRNVDDTKGTGTAYSMPDTPSKRVSFPPVTGAPFSSSVFGRRPPFGLELDSPGTPSTPSLNPQTQQYNELAGKGIRLFANRAGHMSSSSHRQPSLFSSLDNDDIGGSNLSPAPNDGQSSADELPPTPTKPPGGSSRRSKPNSLRSSLLGRRKSIGPDTFVPPSDPTPALAHYDTVTASNSPSPGHARLSTPVAGMSTNVGRASPHTPQGRPVQPNFSASLSSISSGRGPLPATPTAQRDSPATFGRSRGRSSVVGSVFDNNVDTFITARFGVVVLQGKGEFSNVFKVEKPHNTSALGISVCGHQNGVWAVKKTKRPYVGHRDREAKLREVNLLRQLTGNDHIIQYVDSWEANNHLYIQTEYCENGNLKDFLTQAGFKARLDDFRFWKILLELSMGVQHIHSNNVIHLDLKPANVFIDWGGVLKIGDFGLASSWPAPADIDGEGDREYIGPEVLNGKFDKPADIFALGMVMLEIVGNIVLPDNGASWQRLRAGDLCDLPSLTWSTESSLPRDASGEPLLPAEESDGVSFGSQETTFSNTSTSTIQGRNTLNAITRPNELAEPPSFMCDASHAGTMDHLVQWMISPDPSRRPTIEQVYAHEGVQWVAQRRRAGATIYEGNWGPADEVVYPVSDDVDMMDTN